MAANQPDIRETQFDNTPKGQAERWAFEFAAARREVEKWHQQGERIVQRYLDDESGARNDANQRDGPRDGTTRWNFFSANIETQEALLYGKTPTVSVERRFADANDDVARVGGELLERLLNTDIERDEDSFGIAVAYALSDRLLSGMGTVKLCYVCEFETTPGIPAQTQVDPATGQSIEMAPAVPPMEQKSFEDVETDYIHWKDMLWSPCRTFQELRWWAFKSQLTREQLVKRFGKQLGSQVPLNSKRTGLRNAEQVDAQKSDPWARADVWEVWDKERRYVCWYVEGFDQTLDEKPDPYCLKGFWPCPAPLMANLTTSRFLPRPDFALAQDIYNEIDAVGTRITRLEQALKAVGWYDKNLGDSFGRVLMEGTDNQLFPIDNWMAFKEKGGAAGAAELLPLDGIVAALDKLRDYRMELRSALYEITGHSDVMRGEQQENGTPGEAQVKAKFASVRLQAKQDRFAKFVSDAQRLRAELICKLFDPETIIERSNAQFTFDASQQGLVQQAVQFLKDRFNAYRIVVKPENVSLTDFAAQKQERLELMSSLTAYMQAVAPMAQMLPGSIPVMLDLLKWTLSGLKGAASVEGILDQAITQAKQALAQQMANPQQPQQQGPDPKVMSQGMKGQQDQQKLLLQAQIDSAHIQQETQATKERREHDAIVSVHEEAAKHAIKQGMGGFAASAGIGNGVPV